MRSLDKDTKMQSNFFFITITLGCFRHLNIISIFIVLSDVLQLNKIDNILHNIRDVNAKQFFIVKQCNNLFTRAAFLT